MNSNTNRIAKNTLFLYVRTIITLFLSLFTSRLVLSTLGVDDFGIYSVVGGIVAMFSLLNQSLTSASQRYITYELGKKDNYRCNEVFSMTVTIHLLLSVILLLLGETIGLWFLNTQMNIPSERVVAANWVYQCSLLTFILNLLSIPYNASIIAHEKMGAFAYISVTECLLKFLFVVTLAYVSFDKLIVYSILMLLVALLIRLWYVVYCKRYFTECFYIFKWDTKLLQEMFGFAGWNFIGAASSIFSSQGVNILINIFFGVSVNAARGLATQVDNAVTGFVNNFTTALNPQITKSYASGDHKYVMNLIEKGAKFSFCLMLILSLPVIFECEFLLKIWLGQSPGYLCLFVQMSLWYALSDVISKPLITVMLAHGDIKRYQIIVGGIVLQNFTISYVSFKLGAEPYASYIVAIFLSLISLVARLILLRTMISLDVRRFVSRVIFPCVNMAFIALILPLAMKLLFPVDNIQMNILNLLLTFIYVCVVVYFVGLQKSEKNFVVEIIKKKLKR